MSHEEAQKAQKLRIPYNIEEVSEKSAPHARRRPGGLTPRFARTRAISLFSGWHWSALFRRIARSSLRGIESQAENFIGIPAHFGSVMGRPR